MRWQEAILTRVEALSPRVKGFRFELPRPMAFIPGQHVLLRLTAPDGYRAQRSYSIVSAPEPGGSRFVELAIEKLDDGEVSPFMHDVAEAGDTIELGGPLGGHFNWSPRDGPALFIAGGSGIAPFMSMLRHRAASGSNVPVALIFSARTRDELLYVDELSRLADDAFRFAPTLTRERQPHPFRSGRIDAGFIGEVAAGFGAPVGQALICGSNGFVEAAAHGTIAAGVTAGAIRTERYGAEGEHA